MKQLPLEEEHAGRNNTRAFASDHAPRLQHSGCTGICCRIRGRRGGARFSKAALSASCRIFVKEVMRAAGASALDQREKGPMRRQADIWLALDRSEVGPPTSQRKPAPVVIIALPAAPGVGLRAKAGETGFSEA